MQKSRLSKNLRHIGSDKRIATRWPGRAARDGCPRFRGSVFSLPEVYWPAVFPGPAGIPAWKVHHVRGVVPFSTGTFSFRRVHVSSCSGGTGSRGLFFPEAGGFPTPVLFRKALTDVSRSVFPEKPRQGLCRIPPCAGRPESLSPRFSHRRPHSAPVQAFREAAVSFFSPFSTFPLLA